MIGELVKARGQEAVEKPGEVDLSTEAIHLDVTKSASCAALTWQVIASHGRIEALANNARMFILQKSDEICEDDWYIQIEAIQTGQSMSPSRTSALMAVGLHSNYSKTNMNSVSPLEVVTF